MNRNKRNKRVSQNDLGNVVIYDRDRELLYCPFKDISSCAKSYLLPHKTYYYKCITVLSASVHNNGIRSYFSLFPANTFFFWGGGGIYQLISIILFILNTVTCQIDMSKFKKKTVAQVDRQIKGWAAAAVVWSRILMSALTSKIWKSYFQEDVSVTLRCLADIFGKKTITR